MSRRGAHGNAWPMANPSREVATEGRATEDGSAAGGGTPIARACDAWHAGEIAAILPIVSLRF